MHSNNTTVQNPKTGPASPKGSGAAGKARNPKKRAFSLPYISYNLHYTKYYKNQKQRPPSPAFRHSVQVLGASAVLLYHFIWDVWIACQADIVKYSWTRPLHASVHCIRLYSGVSSGCVPKYAQIAS